MGRAVKPLVLERFLPYRLSITANLVSEVIASAYEEAFGLRVPEWRLVAVLGERKKASQQELCEATRMDKMTVSRSARALTSRKLVARAADPRDARAKLLTLTRAGESLYAGVVPQARALEEEIFGSFTAAERATLVRLLERVDTSARGARDARGARG